MDEHAFPPTGFAVAELGCSLQLLFQKVCNDNVIIMVIKKMQCNGNVIHYFQK